LSSVIIKLEFLNKILVFCGGTEQKTPYPPSSNCKKLRFSSFYIVPSFILAQDKKIMAYNIGLMRSFWSEAEEIWEICEPNNFPFILCYMTRTKRSVVRTQRGAE
jgi:hypothetical protein